MNSMLQKQAIVNPPCIQDAQDFKDDEFKHGAWKSKGHREDEEHQPMVDLKGDESHELR